MKFEHTEVMNFKGALRGMRNPLESWDKSDSYFGLIDLNKDTHKNDVAYSWIKSEGENIHSENFDELEAKYIKWLNSNGILRRNENIADVAYIGANDMKRIKNLIKAGSSDRKFMRQIFVSVDITAPMFWWKEFDTYKVATVRNSCSTMHRIHVKEFEKGQFTHDGIDDVGDIAQQTFESILTTLEYYRVKFNETQEKRYWRAIIELLPDSYNMKSTITFNYENILGMCSKGQRRFHKQNEWSGLDYPGKENFISWARTLPYAQELIFIDEKE